MLFEKHLHALDDQNALEDTMPKITNTQQLADDQFMHQLGTWQDKNQAALTPAGHISTPAAALRNNSRRLCSVTSPSV